MNFQQLKIIREAARCEFNLTEVANTLFTSQSGVSRHIRDLEDELGVEIFIRRGKRLLGMTEPGKALLTIAERILDEAGKVRRLADVFTNETSGILTIATTHTQARYSLPKVIKAFRQLYPNVRLELNQGWVLGVRRGLRWAAGLQSLTETRPGGEAILQKAIDYAFWRSLLSSLHSLLPGSTDRSHPGQLPVAPDGFVDKNPL